MHIRCNSAKANEWKTSQGIMIRGGNHHMDHGIYIPLSKDMLVKMGFLKEGEEPNDDTASKVKRALGIEVRKDPGDQFGPDYYMTLSIGDIKEEYKLETYWATQALRQGLDSFISWMRNTHLTIRPEEVYESMGRTEARGKSFLVDYYCDGGDGLTRNVQRIVAANEEDAKAALIDNVSRFARNIDVVQVLPANAPVKCYTLKWLSLFESESDDFLATDDAAAKEEVVKIAQRENKLLGRPGLVLSQGGREVAHGEIPKTPGKYTTSYWSKDFVGFEAYQRRAANEKCDLREYYLDVWLTLTKDMGKSPSEADSLIESNPRVLQDCFDEGEGPVVAAKRIAGDTKNESDINTVFSAGFTLKRDGKTVSLTGNGVSKNWKCADDASAKSKFKVVWDTLAYFNYGCISLKDLEQRLDIKVKV